MLHHKIEDILRGLYKSVSFVLQAIYLRQKGIYVGRQRDMVSLLSPDEKEIADIFINLLCHNAGVNTAENIGGLVL